MFTAHMLRYQDVSVCNYFCFLNRLTFFVQKLIKTWLKVIYLVCNGRFEALLCCLIANTSNT